MVKISPDELSHPQSRAHATDVRYGSKADIAPVKCDVRFTPKSGHSLARQHVRLVPKGDQARRTKIAERRSC